ncbi:uncharacterized protein LOC128395767 [Panonychus citri]|uniref:uncharacterized protein LOC128395767 n=1 Tax=Panonychus citri TaxID=50023 RepID=UPI002307B34C|nr:uncharacterized protein LOC128395767 [Panonychus citri]
MKRYPAKLPPKEEERPSYLRIEFFKKAREEIDQQLVKYEMDKNLYVEFIKEKMKLNVIEDIGLISFDQLPKGLIKSRVIHADLLSKVKKISCLFCEQIAIDPRCCSSCTKIYCTPCAEWLRQGITQVNLPPPKERTEFLCVNENCLIKASTSNSYVKLVPIGDEEIIHFYQDAKFTCNRDWCKLSFDYINYVNHIFTCRRGPIDYSMDKDLKLPNFKQGQVCAKVLEKPRTLAGLLPPHLKAKDEIEVISHEEKWQQTANRFAFLLKMRDENPDDPHLQPISLRAHANLSLNWWNNWKIGKDSRTPLSETEAFLREIGFPSIDNNPYYPGAADFPTVQSSVIPEYLIKDSVNWRKWARGITDFDAESINSDSSSVVMYSAFVEDPESPFIRVNPFDRLAPAEVDHVLEWLEQFPSCVNKNQPLDVPKTTTNQKKVYARNVRRKIIKSSWDNRPKAVLPMMTQERVKLFALASESLENKETSYCLSMFCAPIREGDKLKPRPIWVTIVDGNLSVVYETFVRYSSIELSDENYNGLTRQDLKYGRNLRTVRDQVIKYLVCATRIVGYGIINQFKNIGLTSHEINQLLPSCREINQFYSPYYQSALNLQAIAFLWFPGYVIPIEPHSPVVEAITAMRLFIFLWKDIEEIALTLGGIHHKNAQLTCANTITSSLLYYFDSQVKAGKFSWPEEWKQNPRMKLIPYYNTENCVPPDMSMVNQLLSSWAKELNEYDERENLGNGSSQRIKQIKSKEDSD